MTFKNITLLVMLGVSCSVAAPPTAARAQDAARLLGRAAATSSTSFDVFVPPDPDPALDALLVEQATPGSRHYRRFLTPAQYRARFGSNVARMKQVATALRQQGFAVEAGRAHLLRVSGRVALVERVFATRLGEGVFASGRHALVAMQRLRLPAALARNRALVPGFAPAVHMRRHSLAAGRIARDNRGGFYGPYWVTDLKQAYDMPDIRALDGSGIAVGVLMSGDFNPSDMKLYFQHEKLPLPAMTTEDVYGGAAYDPDGSVETHLDMQQVGGMAPGAAITLYNLPDLSDAAILAGLATIDEDDTVDIVSMSFGAPEILYTAAYNGGQDYTGILGAFDALLKQGNAEGITFVASSGDSGALAAPPPACFLAAASWDCGFFVPSAEHPASSPYVTAVGGTNLMTAADPVHPANLNSAYRSEAAYADLLAYDAFFQTPALGAVWGSGGGISLFEPKPAWQALAPTGSATLRAVPDIAGHMGGCPDAAIEPCAANRSADAVAIDGGFVDVVGTSASAPDIAGMLALKAQHLGSRLGNVNAELYALGHAQRAHTGGQFFRDQSPGYNGFYPASRGYNLVLGNGTPISRRIIGVPNVPPAGVPQTPSNP